MKSNVIVTASDKKYGDFLIEHWLSSLRTNVDISNLDIAILDYGLSLAQRYYLEHEGIIVRSGHRDGHVAVLRYREFAALLRDHPEYQQALLCDSGDMLFQGDISGLFNEHVDSYRAVCEDYKPFFSIFIGSDFFSPSDRQRLSECFIRNPMINGGFVLGPRDKMIALSDECLATILDWTRFGPDQIVLNGILYRDGFIALDCLFNYVLATAKEGIRIVNGEFQTNAGRRPIVVHNAGNVGTLRPIDNFGFGPKFNVLKEEVYLALRTLYQSTEGLFKTQELFLDSRRRFRTKVRKLLKDFGLEEYDTQ